MSRKTWRWIVVLALLVSFVMALRLIGPAVPNEIRMLTGPQGSSFYEHGMRYKELLARNGVTVHLEETSGSVENLEGLTEAEEPTAAFLWGIGSTGAGNRSESKEIESLGAVSLQPLWVFVSQNADLERIKDLRGSRVEAGREGSDARLLALFLLEEEAIDDDVEIATDGAKTPDQALLAVQNQQVAAMVAVGEPDSMLIDTLLRSPEVRAISIRRAEAFAIQHRFLKSIRYPEGAHDLRANIPNQDLQLLAARAQLAVSDLFPPALADLLLQAASEIHRDATAFSARGEFPNPESAALPLNRSADNFYTNGPSKLQKFLPFRLAAWINRFFMAAATIASVAVGIFKILPALIGLSCKVSIKRSYRELESIERLAAAGTDKKQLLDDLAKLDQGTAAIRVPLRSLETEWFELRQYIHDMRDRLSAL